MRAVKAVQIPYQPSEEILSLLGAFRDVVNYSAQVGLEKNTTSRFRLSIEVYHKLSGYGGLHRFYVLSAIETATAILKSYRRAKRRCLDVKLPHARKLMAKLGNQAYKALEDRLRVPMCPRCWWQVGRHLNAAINLLKAQDERLWFGLDHLPRAAVNWPLSKAGGGGGEEVLKMQGNQVRDRKLG